jgi:hypothetical protein
MFGLLVVLFVKAKKESGFWRAKRFWPFDGVEVDAADLSKEDLAAIKAEPMLIVKEKGKKEQAAAKDKEATTPPPAPPVTPPPSGEGSPPTGDHDQEPATPAPNGPAPEPGTGEELTGEQMEEMTVDELRALAKVLGLSGYSEAKKADLIKMVSEALKTDAANAQE